MIDTYAIYCQWCKDHHQTPPTKAWWDAACRGRTIPKAKPVERVVEFQSDFEFDLETERQEGWGYDNL